MKNLSPASQTIPWQTMVLYSVAHGLPAVLFIIQARPFWAHLIWSFPIAVALQSAGIYIRRRAEVRAEVYEGKNLFLAATPAVLVGYLLVWLPLAVGSAHGI